jgi:hypothetical protein
MHDLKGYSGIVNEMDNSVSQVVTWSFRAGSIPADNVVGWQHLTVHGCLLSIFDIDLTPFDKK